MASDREVDETLIERIEAELEEREDLVSYEIDPGETAGVVVTVETADTVEHYHVTLERRPEGEPKVHWTSIGEEFRG